ncbi:unnamed protein product [Ilex paraguariensis]|uniref:Uncharacterized protein n=1 Tax=Ilex paraguariensis TaxID=185542 RepID=A0ABC8THH3_9AQUA
MGSVIGSLSSGFVEVVGNLFGHPLDFLAGKSCSSTCGSTWDFICYIENFCIAHLLKLAIVAALFYLVLLFFYLSHKLGICECICTTLCKITWACFATCFSVLEYSCTFLCYKLPMLKRKHRDHKREMVMELYPMTCEEEEPKHRKERRSLSSRRWRDYRGDHLRRSLRPRSHRIRVGISGDSAYGNRRNPIKHGGHATTVHDIRVSRTSKFVQKGGNYKGAIHRRRR